MRDHYIFKFNSKHRYEQMVIFIADCIMTSDGNEVTDDSRPSILLCLS